MTFLIPLYLSTLNTHISFVQEEPHPFFALPEGAIARLGNGRIYDVKYSNDGMQLAVASSIGVWIYDAITYKPLRLMTNHTESVKALAVHPTSKNILSIDGSHHVYFTNLATGALYQYFIQLHASKVAIGPKWDVFAVNGTSGVRLHTLHMRSEKTKVYP